MKRVEVNGSAERAWIAAIGSAYVITDAGARTAASSTTFPVLQTVRAILRPASTAEVQACVRIANDAGVPLYPVSAGKNWGLGSRAPSADGCALLDLSRLDRILEFDEDLAYITVEPGVTFRAAQEFLHQRGSRLYLSAIGGPDTASLIGNALERGDGHGPYSDRASYACAAEVVMPDGRVIHTGFARFPEARVAPLARWGVGPSLDGLFSQSNLGIVTRMTFWLAPVADWFETFSCTVPATRALREFIDALRLLMLRDILRPGCIAIWNAYKALASEGRYPWRAMEGKTPLDLSRVAKGGEPWFATGTLLAWSADHLKSLSSMVRERLGALGDFTSFALDSAESDKRSTFPLGISNMRTSASLYWRKKSDVPSLPDPDRDRCGAIWVCPQLPFVGAEVIKAIEEFEPIFAKHGFEPNIGMAPITARSMHLFLAILYDRDVAGEDERAMACQAELHESAMHLGFPPYRLGIQSMSVMSGGEKEYVEVLRQLKRTLDPNDVLAPGRYDWRHEWRTDDR